MPERPARSVYTCANLSNRVPHLTRRLETVGRMFPKFLKLFGPLFF